MMSAIDSLDNAHVANFFDLPIYWVFNPGKLINITDNPKHEGELIDQYSLCIGGGSGEHPALVINNDGAIFRFLHNVQEEQLFEVSPFIDFDREIYKLSDKIFTKFEDSDEMWDNYSFDSNEWPLSTFIKFSKKYQEIGINDDLETVIMDSIAMLLIYEMPIENCIKDPDLLQIAKMIRSNKWMAAFKHNEVDEKFLPITGLLGCGKMGKIVRDNEVFWGYSLNDWKIENSYKRVDI